MGLRLKSRLRSFSDRYRKSVSVQLLSAVLLVSSAVTFVTTGVQLGLNYRDEIRDLHEDLDNDGKGYSTGITQSMWEMNSSQIQAELRGMIRQIPGLQYVEISEGEKVLFSAGKAPVGNAITRSFPLDYQKPNETVHLGQLRLMATTDLIYAKLRKTLIFIFLSQLIKTLIVSTLVLLIIRHILIRHLIAITNYLKELEFSALTGDLQLSRKKEKHNTQETQDELDVLVGAINKMKANLYQSYENLNTFNQQLESKVEDRTKQLRESQKIIVEQQKALVASAKMSALGEMANGIAHEINNPLAAIQSLSYLMSKALAEGQFEKEELRRMLTSMTGLTDRIARIIKGLRDFSRDASDDPIQSIEVRHLIDRTLSFCAERFKAHDIALIVDAFSDNLQFEGRSTELSQVLLNLLNNSFDALLISQITPPQSLPKEKWIRITVRDLGSNVEIRVTDSGLGIPAEFQKKIFQPFFTTKDIGQGTGLGLSISFGILKTHHGELLLDEQSQHTSFVIRVPKKQGLLEEQAIC